MFLMDFTPKFSKQIFPSYRLVNSKLKVTCFPETLEDFQNEGYLASFSAPIIKEICITISNFFPSL